MKESGCDLHTEHLVQLKLDFDDFLTHFRALLIVRLSALLEVLLKRRLSPCDVLLDAVALGLELSDFTVKLRHIAVLVPTALLSNQGFLNAIGDG